MGFLDKFNPFKKRDQLKEPAKELTPPINKKEKVSIPGSRVSLPPKEAQTDYEFVKDELKMIRPNFAFEVIPYIRYLIMANADFSQALNNIVTLGNTGFDLEFDPSVSPEQQQKMNAHLEKKWEQWGINLGGQHGLINRMFSQAMIGGAISNEWVPEFDLSGIQRIVFVNPEEIRFSHERKRNFYQPFQKVVMQFQDRKDLVQGQYIKLNPYTYRYTPINGDSEIPYGFPPYLAALAPLKTQRTMVDNINFIVEQMGIIGFLEALLDKPQRESNENEHDYGVRLDSLLDQAKARVQKGFRDGVTVGYKGDVEYNFNSATKNVGGVSELFQENELQVFSGLNSDGSLHGRGYSSSETQITIIFTKMLSELGNVQNAVIQNIKYGLALELRMAGFTFDSLKVKSKPSTLLDELKYQQGREYKLKNITTEYVMGWISQETAAKEAGHEKSDQKQPRVPLDSLANNKGGSDPKDRQDQKNKSAKKTRDKKSPNPSPDNKTRKKEQK